MPWEEPKTVAGTLRSWPRPRAPEPLLRSSSSFRWCFLGCLDLLTPFLSNIGTICVCKCLFVYQHMLQNMKRKRRRKIKKFPFVFNLKYPQASYTLFDETVKIWWICPCIHENVEYHLYVASSFQWYSPLRFSWSFGIKKKRKKCKGCWGCWGGGDRDIRINHLFVSLCGKASLACKYPHACG